MSDERRRWDERLNRRLIRRPFTDTQGRKSWWLRPFAKAPAHVVRRYSLTLAGWPRLPQPLRIAFLSDFHLGSHADDVARLTALTKEVSSFEPDLVLLGGDYVNMQSFGRGRIPPRVIAHLLAQLTARYGRFAVLGNHDYAYGEIEIAAALRDHGIAVLDHERASVTIGHHSIDVVGLPDAHMIRQRCRELLASLTPDRPAIVLTHDPVWFKDVPAGPHLTLAGHTHGGQVRLPGLGILTNASKAPLRWSHGLVVEGGRHMIVTAGLGTSGIPLRVGVPPEFVIIEVAGD